MGWSLASPAGLGSCGEQGVPHVGIWTHSLLPWVVVTSTKPPGCGLQGGHGESRPRGGVKRQVGPDGTQWHLLAPDGTQWDPVGSNGTQWDPVGPGSPAAEGGWPGIIPRPLS